MSTTIESGAEQEAGRGRGPRNRVRADVASTGPAAVNLLSPWVLDELRVRRLRLRFLAGGVVLVVLLGLGWAGLRMSLASAQRDLRDDQAITDALQDQVTDMAPVRAYAASVDVRNRQVAETMSSEVAFSRAAVKLQAALPRGADLDSLELSLAGGADPVPTQRSSTQATCPGPDPFGARPIVGCIQLTGTARSREDVSRYVLALAASKFFVEPFISTTTTSEQQVSFSGTVGLDPTLLRGEYVDPVAEAGPETAPITASGASS